jgi:hypothetical protein
MSKLAKTSHNTDQGLTAKKLADELNVEVTSLIPLLAQMGMKEATPDTLIPPAIAKNAKIAHNQLTQRIESNGKGDEIVNLGEAELTKDEIKAIANNAKTTQKVVRNLWNVVRDRKIQLAFLEGLQEVELNRQKKEAKEIGQLVGQLEQIKDENEWLDARELELANEAQDTSNTPIQIAKKFGINLPEKLSELQQYENERNSRQFKPTEGEEEHLNPFQKAIAVLGHSKEQQK